MHLLQRFDGEVAVKSTADARLVWTPSHSGNVPAGAWWPGSRDATAELSELVPMVERHLGGSVTRVSLNIDAWDVAHQPRRLQVNGRALRLGWFHTLDPATVTVARGSGARITVHVVPPELEPTAAREMLRELSANSS